MESDSGSCGRGTVLSLAQRLGSAYPTTIYNIERTWQVPNLPVLGKHAAALGCHPWELLDGVETEYDMVRSFAKFPYEQAMREWHALLSRYAARTARGVQRPTARAPIVKGGRR